jgi:hypothetical protein
LLETKSLVQVIFNKPWDIYLRDLRLIQSWAEVIGQLTEEEIEAPEASSISEITEGSNASNIQESLDSFLSTESVEEFSELSSSETESVEDQVTLVPREEGDKGPIVIKSQPPYIEEILRVAPQLEKCENAFIYALKSAYNNKRAKNSISLSTLKRNLTSDNSASDLKQIFSLANSRFHQIPVEKPQTLLLTTDGRSFLEKYKLTSQ